MEIYEQLWRVKSRRNEEIFVERSKRFGIKTVM